MADETPIQEYPKHISIQGQTFTAESEAHEAELLGGGVNIESVSHGVSEAEDANVPPPAKSTLHEKKVAKKVPVKALVKAKPLQGGKKK